jgi:pyrroloquinoline quinone biosynthesis protein B
MDGAVMIEAIALGSAQDGGVPQAGCACSTCSAARRNPALRRMVACLALVDHGRQSAWLIDATPDFPRQLDLLTALAPGCTLRGILLTHGHIGHYTGLMHLGREVMGTSGLPVYASAALSAFLRTNGPWSQLVALGNIDLHLLAPQIPLPLTPDLVVTPIPVPHRNEFSDTLAFLVDGGRRLFYCPDIDRWQDWEFDLATFANTLDIALLDGTFYSADELPGRDLAEIPHPLVTTTAALLAGTTCAVHFVHLNHSNPLLGMSTERAALAALGMHIVEDGQRWTLRE